MNSFFSWFKGSTKAKRWIILILAGVVLTCYSFSKILVNKEIEFSELWKVIVMFVFGFLFIVIGIVFLQKRTLELIIEANGVNQKNAQKSKVNMQSLIFNRKVYEEGPKIVVIGGGAGLNTVIEGLKKYTSNITAIVTMSDYGRNATVSRAALESFPLNDIKDCIISMSDHEDLMKNLMTHKFSNERLYGLNFGDIYFTAMNEMYSNISEAIQKSTEVLNITGKVIPATLDEVTICAELNDGTVIEQKDRIPEIVAEKVESINRIFISPSNCIAAPGVLEAIEQAEAIIIGPGSLYTNVIPNLLVKNVARAIKDSKAIKIYISNIMTEQGQTDNYTLADHINALQMHVGTGVFDIVLADSSEVMPEFIRKYNQEGADIVEDNISEATGMGVKIVERNFSCIRHGRIRHDPDVVASYIIERICNNLKFQDRQNETEYLLLNSVLKKQKEMEENYAKQVAKTKNKPKQKAKPKTKGKSKFAMKYKDRIETIQNTDTIIEKNKKEMQNNYFAEKNNYSKSFTKNNDKSGKRTVSKNIDKLDKVTTNNKSIDELSKRRSNKNIDRMIATLENVNRKNS